MSYDLYFYKRPGNPISRAVIGDYIAGVLGLATEVNANQWCYENKDTEVYFSIEYDTPGEDENDYPGEFEHTGFSFNINYMRPDFFGLEAFPLVERMVSELDLFVFNPQVGAASGEPHKPSANSLYKNWSDFNLVTSKDNYRKYKMDYYPLEASNSAWQTNFNRKRVQQEITKAYFAPRLFFCKIKSSSKIITVCSWTQHIPTLIPKADYYMLLRNYWKLFRQINEKGLVSYETLLKTFGKHFEPSSFDDSLIIHPETAKLMKKVFNKIQFEYLPNDIERVNGENISNAI